MELKVCGVDPGTTKTAVVVWNGQAILDRRIIPNLDVIKYLADAGCQVVCCEHMECHGMAVGKETFETAYWIGRFWQVCDILDIEWMRVMRSTIKSYWCHSQKATDSNIRRAVLDRLGPPGVKKKPGVTYGVAKDMWSALAIAVRCHDIKSGTPE